MEVAIRAAADADLAAVTRLWHCLHDYHISLVPSHFQKLTDAWIAETFERNQASAWSEFLIAELEGEAVGFCLVGIEDPTHPGVRPIRRGIIYELVVDPAHRSRGVGRVLLDHAAGWARLRGARQMALYVFEGNPRARAFYEELGWSCEMRRMVRPIGST